MTSVITSNRGAVRADLRERIYSAAIDAFRRNSFQLSTVEAITKQAGVAKGTFFNFYATKLDVLAEYYWRLDAEIAPLRAKLDPARPLEALVRYATRVEAIFAREGELLLELLSLARSDGRMRNLDEGSGASDAAQFVEFVEKCIGAGTIRPKANARDTASLLIDLWAGAIREWIASGRTRSIARNFKAKLSLLFEGLAPPRG